MPCLPPRANQRLTGAHSSQLQDLKAAPSSWGGVGGGPPIPPDFLWQRKELGKGLRQAGGESGAGGRAVRGRGATRETPRFQAGETGVGAFVTP